MLPTKFRFIWHTGFREEDFQKSTIQKQELPVTAIFVNGSGRNEQSLQRTFLHVPSFGSFGKAVLEKIVQKSTNQKQELSVTAIFANGSGRNEKSLKRTFHTFVDASYQVSVHLAKEFQRRRFLQKSTNQKQELPMVAMFNVN